MLVSCPWLSRPPVLRTAVVRLRSGVFLVISAKSNPTRWRWPGVIGRYCFKPTLEPLDGLGLRGNPHQGLLPGLGLARPHAHAHPAALGTNARGVHRGHLHIKKLLHRHANLVLVRLGMDLEGVPA